MRMLEQGLTELGAHVNDVALFLADLGPGSFTGVRVGVTLAKTLAYANGVKAGGATAFDLVDPSGAVALPSKRGEWFVRQPGEAPYRTQELPPGDIRGIAPDYPNASRFLALLDRIEPVDPEQLVPAYLIEPSISLPKKPFGVDVAQ
jgi:hypothetical protein